MSETQQKRFQAEVQSELERREWAEPGDNVMAEYITVLIANGSTRERVQAEMDDLVGADFDSQFLDWLFQTASQAQQVAEPPAPRAPSPVSSFTPSNRILNSALASTREDSNKRKAGMDSDLANKKRIPEGLPLGPRAMTDTKLSDRLGPRQMPVRGFAARQPIGHVNAAFQPGFRPPMPQFGFFPQQQEMMAQMMMMQSSMAQMGQMMQKMAEEKEEAQAAPVTGYSDAPVKITHNTKLGSHSVSPIRPKQSAPVPGKPSSKALCKYSVGCSNSRCIYSHPSPVADEKTGMVLSDEACEEGKDCKDAECTKSHVSPAAALGASAGPTRLLCKYQNCTNPACPFRHEDAEGNAIPPPALSAARGKKVSASSDNEDGDIEVVMTKNTMDGALDDSKTVTACRFGDRCTRPDCKFSHPSSRVAPKPRGSYTSRGVGRRPIAVDNVAKKGMNKSKKFGEKLDPSAGAFVPKDAAAEVSAPQVETS